MSGNVLNGGVSHNLYNESFFINRFAWLQKPWEKSPLFYNSAVMSERLRNLRQQRSKAGDNRTVLCPSRHSFYRLLTKTDGFDGNLLKSTPCIRVSSSSVQCFPFSRASWGVTNSDRIHEKCPIQTRVMVSPSSHALEILHNTRHDILCWLLTRISPRTRLQRQPSPVEKLDLSVRFPAASTSPRKLVQSPFVQEVWAFSLFKFILKIWDQTTVCKNPLWWEICPQSPLGWWAQEPRVQSWTRGEAWLAHSSWHVDPEWRTVIIPIISSWNFIP